MVAPKFNRFILPRILAHEYELGALAKLGSKSGKELLSFDVADPNLDTPKAVKDAMILALRRDSSATHYTRIRGLPAFVSAVSEFYSQFQIKADPMEEVLATAGSGEGLFIVFAATVKPGDQFLLPNPTFPNYASILEMLGGVPRFVRCKSDFHLDLKAIEEGITPKTKAIVLCTPNNPTGAVYTRQELSGLLQIARRKDLMIISDENYSQVTYDGVRHVSIGSLPKAMERTIIVNGLSKVYAMTGWRLGYLIARPEWIAQFEKLAFEIRGSVNTAVQYAGAAALRSPPTLLKDIVRHYDVRRRLLVSMLREAGLQCHLPEGGFEAFPSLPVAFKGDSVKFATFLALRGKVLVKPGRYFGPAGDRNFRMVYCVDKSRLIEGAKRISNALKRL